MQVWKTVRSFGTVADWSAPIGMERITSILLVSLSGIAMQARFDGSSYLMEAATKPAAIDMASAKAAALQIIRC